MEYIMSAKRSGNSLTLIIPKEIKKLMKIKEGDVLRVVIGKIKK